MECLFCSIVKGEIPSTKVYEDDKIVAFLDLQPQAPSHVLVIPKRHISSLGQASPEDLEVLGHLQLKVDTIAQSLGIAQSGYRLVTNVGQDGGQTVGHIHYHLLGGRSMQWPPG